jgi:eukaryotic-like serine/threonine-protein kinase
MPPQAGPPNGASGREKEELEPTILTAGSFSADAPTALPASIGHYRILRLVGEGGMGAVYEAEQENPHRTVALKVIRAGYASGEMLRRFENEAQALGRLQHPGIAQIYEAGTADTPFGKQPYFAMELVRGQTLLAYCDEHKLNTRQRLELMARICDAVQHAHQRGLIHRDLKPANILVDESGLPRILDFGVARLTDSDAQATRQTDIGEIIGTLQYMSPEQVLADPLALDTRSDVYALGVILYELLAGRMPYTLSRQIHEAVRTIQETDASPLSVINKTYRGDIETIVAKALEKDKNRRYASAAELAADIRRYLHDEPIVARPPSTTYQLGKFARRNRALVTGVAAVFVVLVLGTVASTWEAVQARRAEKKARQESAIAQAVNDFLQKDLLGQASAYNQSKPDPNITVRTVLDRAAQNIQGKFTEQPEVEASIRDTIGQTYMDLGLYPEARAQLERALDLDRRAVGLNNRGTLKTMSLLGRTAWLQGRYPDAEKLCDEALQIQRRVLGPLDLDTLDSMYNLGTVYYLQGKYPQAERTYSQVLDMRRRVLGPENPDTLASMGNLAIADYAQGKYAQAEALDRQILAIDRRVLGPEHPNTLKIMNNLGNALVAEGKNTEAAQILGQTVEIRRRILGPEHPDTVSSAYNLSIVYQLLGEFPQAETLANQALAGWRRVLGPEHQNTLNAISNLANVYYSEGKYVQSETLQGQALEIQRRVLGPDHPDTLLTMAAQGETYTADGKYAQAEVLLTHALEAQRRVLGSDHPYTLTTLSDMATMYQWQGRYDQAETYAAEVFARRQHVSGLDNPDTMQAAADLALVNLSQRKFDQSEPLAREAFEFDSKERPDDWQRFHAESLLGASLAGQKKYAEAEPLLIEGYRGMLQREDHVALANRYDLRLAHAWIVQLYRDWGPSHKP